MRRSVRNAVVGLFSAGALVAPGAAVATDVTDLWGGRHHRHCEAEFEEAQRADMESFRDFDAETFRAVHHEDAVSIFPSGARFAGIDDIMDAQEAHFRDKEAIWSWTEIDRQVVGCRTAFIEYEAVYELPSIDYYQRALTAVTYVRQRGEWLAILDQGTMLELRTGDDQP